MELISVPTTQSFWVSDSLLGERYRARETEREREKERATERDRERETEEQLVVSSLTESLLCFHLSFWVVRGPSGLLGSFEWN